MQPETFKTRREFNNRFPSRIYYCSECGRFTINPYYCTNCGSQANDLFAELSKHYRYIIEEETGEVQTIFRPVELK